MKAVIYNGPRNVSVGKVDDARIEKPTDVIIRITTTNMVVKAPKDLNEEILSQWVKALREGTNIVWDPWKGMKSRNSIWSEDPTLKPLAAMDLESLTGR